MSTYKGRGDDCTDIILDLLAEHESNGNYNATIGHVQASDDLSRYSLGEIYGLMDRLLAQGEPSTAIGRYQIIRDTLHRLQTKKGLGDNARFTPELQDQLAVSLLVGRGYPAWWDGRLSDEEFAHNLSCEWASLPDPLADGRSHYDGDGINSAGTTLAHVYDGLGRARAAQKAAPAASDDRGGIVGWIKGLFR